ncbi:hypothetical protein Zmor_011928 [Zophobas morio]|uniref:VWFA domain-containing protein n=1 Tax=Zophobas morio TaxID=2755281 RepID=A0AA38HIR2_9CUCU|nr:hypothetical protein Zmor_011928 [Zophobas morio]
MTRTVIVTFNNNTKIHNNFSENSSHDRIYFNKVIKTVEFLETDLKAGTFLGSALKKVNKTFQVRDPSQKNRKKIIVLITDGTPSPQDKWDAYDVAQKLRGMNPPYHLIAFGIGNYDENKLTNLTGDKKLIFKASSFEKLHNQLKSFADKICTVDCEFTEWVPWGNCTLADERQIWKREKVKVSHNGGEECYPLEKESTCQLVLNKNKEPVDKNNGLIINKSLKKESTIITSREKEKYKNKVKLENTQELYRTANPKVHNEDYTQRRKNILPLAVGLAIGSVALVSGITGLAFYLKKKGKEEKESFSNNDMEATKANNPIYKDLWKSKDNPALY